MFVLATMKKGGGGTGRRGNRPIPGLAKYTYTTNSTTTAMITRHGSTTSPPQPAPPAPPAPPPSSSSSLISKLSSNLNYKYIHDNAELIFKNMQDRYYLTGGGTATATTLSPKICPFRVRDLYQRCNQLEYHVNSLRRRRNEIADKMKSLAKSSNTITPTPTPTHSSRYENDHNINHNPNHHHRLRAALVNDGKQIKFDIQQQEAELDRLKRALYHEALHIPNNTCPSVPVGKDEEAAKLIEIVGIPREKSASPYPLQPHIDLLDRHNLAEFERAGKVTGSGFYYLKNEAALLELAIINYAMEACVRRGFIPVSTPDLIRRDVLTACGFSPRSDDPQTYFIQRHISSHNNSYQQQQQASSSLPEEEDGDQLCLTATSEFPLAAMYANEVLMERNLPLKMVAFGHCFRAEGLAGSLNRGLYRVHQFSKVEMFSITTPTQSEAMMQEFVDVQRGLFENLGLCFRILNMPTGDLGAPAFKKYDMEAWMPGRDSWGEISSTSNCTDYQSRRLNIRYLPTSGGSNSSKINNNTVYDFAHTVNGTAAAIPRLIVAILETFQLENGDVIIPEALRRYLIGGKSRIENGRGLLENLQKENN